MEEENFKKLLFELTKSQVGVKSILETFAFENKIELNLSNEKILKNFLNNINKDDIDMELFNTLLGKMK